MVDVARPSQPTLQPHYDDPNDQRVASIVNEILDGRSLSLDQLPMKDIIAEVNRGNTVIEPGGLDRSYLEAVKGAGYVVEWSSGTAAAPATGVPFVLFSQKFSTPLAAFVSNVRPITTYTGVGAAYSGISPTDTGIVVVNTNATAQNFEVNYIAIRARGN